MAPQEKFSPMPARTIAIGDIHGHSRALAALLENVKPQPQDTLVFLGDSIDRGPDSRGVVEQVIALQERCHVVPLMGNHEEMLLNARETEYALRADLPSPHYSGKTAVLGHTPQLDGRHVVCIDTGCGYGGVLTAMDVGTGRIWQVGQD